MKKSDLNKLVKKHNGWWEDDIARFPTPYNMEQFLKDIKEAEKND